MRATENIVDSDEHFFNIGIISHEYTSLLNWEVTTKLVKGPFFFHEGGPIVGGILTELRPQVIVNSRKIYNSLDFLGDVGGLQEALNRLGFAFMYFFGAHGLQGHIISSIFKV